MKLTIAALFLAAPLLPAGTGMETIIKIDSGWVAGSGTTVRTYKGIPYAAPPVGELRWKPPQPAKPWKGIRLAKDYPASCLQPQPIPAAPQKQSARVARVHTGEELCSCGGAWQTDRSTGSGSRPIPQWCC